MAKLYILLVLGAILADEDGNKVSSVADPRLSTTMTDDIGPLLSSIAHLWSWLLLLLDLFLHDWRWSPGGLLSLAPTQTSHFDLHVG
jgi:hypothetical protein